MYEKRGYWKFFMFLVCFFLFVNFFMINVSAQDKIESFGDAWEAIKETGGNLISAPLKFVTDKVGWVLGTKNLGGTNISWFNPISYVSTVGWQYVLFFVMIIIWMSLLFPLVAHADPNDPYEIEASTLLTDFFAFIYQSWKGVLFWLVLYIFFMGVPVLNRFIQIITLEFLGIHWLWRSLIIAIIISFWKPMMKSYNKGKRKKKKYKRELEDAAIKEVARAELKG